MVVTRRLRAWLRAVGLDGARSAPVPSACLRALAAAALALPGVAASLAPSAAQAEPRDALRLQYGRYEESRRSLPGVSSRFDPIDVDYLAIGATTTVADRWRVSLDFTQDTWSGATPITSAPRSLFGNRASAPDGVSGATPYVAGQLFFDADLNVLESDLFGNLTGRRDPGPIQTLSSASPETRKQIDLGLDYDWDDARVGVSGGVSIEPDYLSGFVRADGSLDFDRKRTRVDFAASLAASAIDARLDHDAAPYIDLTSARSAIHGRAAGRPTLRDERRDWTLEAGVGRILTASTRIEARLQYRASTGYLANPYKVVEVAFLDPAQQFLAPPGGFFGDVHALLERRPGTRNQVVVSGQLLQDVARLEAALSLRYSLAHDDWGIDAHTVEGQWRQQLGETWLVTPRIRYASQSAARFRTPLLVSSQAYATPITDPGGGVIGFVPFDHTLLPSHYASDQRLSAFGVLTGGLSVQKRLRRGFVFDLGFEYSHSAADLRLGGGSADFLRFDSWLASAALRVDLDALALARLARSEGQGAGASSGRDGPSTDPSASHSEHVAHAVPAGVMFAHALSEAGDFMLGYRTMYMRRHGDIRHGAHGPSDAEIVARACDGAACSTAPRSMVHQMHMLELMVAPSRRLTLMLMPSFVDQDMRFRALAGGAPDPHAGHDRHASGGLGDTRFGPIVSLLHAEHDRVALAAIVSAPSGDTSLRFRRSHQSERGFLHYDMQLGSGTWDFLPAVTYSGERGRFRFGAQALGIVRLEHEGRTGYALGDEAQISAWGGFAIADWLAATARTLYTHQGRIRGRFDRPTVVSTPADSPANSGGELFDLGLGLTLSVPRGGFAGMQLSLEWLQPVAETWNGYQLERTGALAATWGMTF